MSASEFGTIDLSGAPPPPGAAPAPKPSASATAPIHEISRLARRRFTDEARAQNLGLTLSQATALSLLSRHEGINQAALALLMEIEPITLVRLLDRLQAAGWVERRPDAYDRRAWVLYLTPKALPVIDRIRAVGAVVHDHAIDGMTVAEQAELARLLSMMKNNLLARITRDPPPHSPIEVTPVEVAAADVAPRDGVGRSSGFAPLETIDG